MMYLLQGIKDGKEVLGTDTEYLMEYKTMYNLKKYGVMRTIKTMRRHNIDHIAIYNANVRRYTDENFLIEVVPVPWDQDTKETLKCRIENYEEAN